MSPRIESLTTTLQRRPLLATVLLCALPYLALLAHVAAGTTPSLRTISVYILIGGIVPFTGLIVVLVRVVRDRTRFRLLILLQTYAALVLIFATLYGLLQTAGRVPSIHGMQVWAGGHPTLSTLHAILGDALYLSVITITTVGFGDLVPLSPLAKLLSALEGLAGIAFMGLALGHYFSVCTHCAAPSSANVVEESQP